jgi:glycosyl transferase family 25
MNFNNILNKPAFVIHIKELSPERTDFFTNNIKNAGYTDMQIFKGVNAKNENELQDILQNFKNPILHPYMNIGQIGCLFSHLKLYKYIINNNIDICTIFEDDVHFHPEWNVLSQKFYDNTAKDFDIIFMGNQIHIDNNTPRINNYPCFCTHAYILTLEGAKKLLYLFLNFKYEHNSLGLYIIDNMIKNVQENMNNKKIKKILNWYCWNGTNNKCDFNKLPLTGINLRNSGLVFQSDKFVSTIL